MGSDGYGRSVSATGETLSIPSRCNGPLDSGNGGCSAGALAQRVDAAVVEVSLRRPVPLDVPMTVAPGDGGDDAVRLLDGDALVAEARPADDSALALDVPAVGVEEARAASARYRGLTDGPFCRCYVCGRLREDAFGVFAGRVADREVVASPWTPPAWTAGADGRVLPEHVWAVLDCPTYFATYLDAPDPLPLGVLARLTARRDTPVVAGEEHVAIAWPLAVDGRKREAGAAVLSAGGELLALARALLIEPRAA